MSSSRIFKADAAFTPMPIVRRVLDPDEALLPEPAQAETPPAAAPAPPAAAEPAEVVDLEALREEAYNQGMADLSAQWET